MRYKKPFYSSTLKKEVKQINIIKAKKLFEQGKTIYLKCSNMMFDSFWQGPCPIVKNGNPWFKDNFDTIVNDFKYYNCSYETGRYPNFFVEV